MTTNITPTEAIELIQKQIKDKYSNDMDKLARIDVIVRATQALVPQECDVKDEQILYGSRLAGKNIQRAYQLVDWMAKNKGCKSYAILTLDKLKQLHSQQKTFTVEKVITKCKARIGYIKNKLSGCQGYSNPEKQIRYEELQWVISEFEKEVK